MKVRLLTCLSGTSAVFNAGDEYECNADEAQRLVEAGFAEHIREVRMERAASISKRKGRNQ